MPVVMSFDLFLVIFIIFLRSNSNLRLVLLVYPFFDVFTRTNFYLCIITGARKHGLKFSS